MYVKTREPWSIAIAVLLFYVLRLLTREDDKLSKKKEKRRHKEGTIVRRHTAKYSFFFDFHGEESKMRTSYGGAEARKPGGEPESGSARVVSHSTFDEKSRNCG